MVFVLLYIALARRDVILMTRYARKDLGDADEHGRAPAAGEPGATPIPALTY